MRTSKTLIALGIFIISLGISIIAFNSSLFDDVKKVQFNPVSCDANVCYDKLPRGYTPAAAYWHGYLSNSGRVSLWRNERSEIYQTPDGIYFNNLTREGLETQGLPITFRPIVGIYNNISGGRVIIFNSTGGAYFTDNGFGGHWQEYTEAQKTTDGLPANYKPVAAIYMNFSGGVGTMALINANGDEYRTNTELKNNPKIYSWRDATDLYNLYPSYPDYLKGKAPNATYFYRINGEEHNDYWFDINGRLELYRYNPLPDNFERIFPQGIPPAPAIPNEGYFDFIRNKIVIWYGTDSYESSDGVNFKKSNCDASDCATDNDITLPQDCEDSQIILKLSNYTNAHGALWDDNIYNYPVCYSRIFGLEYIPYSEEDSHACNGNNTILDLAEILNAHADGTEEIYNIKVCYGDLNCGIANKTETCSDIGQGFRKIVSLSDEKDAHLTIKDNYNFKVCCKTEQIQGPTDGCAEGTTLCSDGTCQTECTNFECNNNNICNENEGCQCGDCQGYIDSCSESNKLICDFHTDTCQPCPEGTTFNSGTCTPDSPPKISIVQPVKSSEVSNWQKFKANTQISFKQISSNLKKDLNITWNFRDGNTRTIGNCLTSGNCNTTHAYSYHGHYTIDATAREQGGIKSANDFVDILVYHEGLNVFAIISNPVYGTVIPNGESVRFNANESFVAECFTTNSVCNTVSGVISCYNVGDLSCYNLPRPAESGFSTFNYDFIFNWTFDKDTSHAISLYGKWNDKYSEVVNFKRVFTGEQGTNHSAQLIVKYRKET